MNPQPHRTDWFHRAQWGVACHYIAEVTHRDAVDKLTADQWNAEVDAVNVRGLADQLAAAGAGFFMLTLGQNSGFYCAPNEAYDRFVGIRPSKCSRRDLVGDLADALGTRGIRLIVYLPSGAPAMDEVACERLGWEWGFEGGWPHGWQTRTGKRLVPFQQKWEAVIWEWSERWGTKVSGWWFDGCYFADEMYQHSEPPNFHSFAASARAGNPESILAFNPGIMVKPLTDAADYVAGETNEPDRIDCPGRWVEGPGDHRSQFFMWSYLGPSWGQSPSRLTDEQAVTYTRNIVDCDGVVMWDVPPQLDGLIPEPFCRQLRVIGENLRP